MRLTKEDRRRLTRAQKFALRWHANQERKNSEVPYISHLVQVMGIVLEHSGDIDQAIAGLFHDALEDAPDASQRQIIEATIREHFGDDVMQIVLDCTDTGADESIGEKAPWRERKEGYIARLAGTSERSLLVAACDKRHNLYTLVWDVRCNGTEYLTRFNATSEQQIWYYTEVLKTIRARIPAKLSREMDALLSEFRNLIAADE